MNMMTESMYKDLGFNKIKGFDSNPCSNNAEFSVPPRDNTWIEYHDNMKKEYDMFVKDVFKPGWNEPLRPFYVKGDFDELVNSIFFLQEYGESSQLFNGFETIEIERTKWNENNDWRYDPFKITYTPNESIVLRYLSPEDTSDNIIKYPFTHRTYVVGYGDTYKSFTDFRDGLVNYRFTVTNYEGMGINATLNSPHGLYVLSGTEWRIWRGYGTSETSSDDLDKLAPLIRKMKAAKWEGYYDDMVQIIMDSGIDTRFV